MSALAPILEAFFTDRLVQQRHASPHTIAAYRDAWRLLLRFAATDLTTTPSKLKLGDLDAPLIARFLEHLEHDRANSARSRNARLSAIHALFRYAALEHPDQAAVIARVLAIPPKRGPRGLVTFLSDVEIDALLAAPDRATWTGRRDHTLLALAIQTGLRLGAHRAARCRSEPRPGSARQLPRKRPQAADHAAHQDDGRGPASVARRARRHTRHPGLSDADRPPAQPGRARTTARDTRSHRHDHLSLSPREEHHPAHAAPHRRHATAARRGRHHRHRAVARTRTRRHDQYLHPCRPRLEGTRAGENHPCWRPPRPLSTPGQAPGLSRRPLIMPMVSAQTPPATGVPAPTSA